MFDILALLLQESDSTGDMYQVPLLSLGKSLRKFIENNKKLAGRGKVFTNRVGKDFYIFKMESALKKAIKLNP